MEKKTNTKEIKYWKYGKEKQKVEVKAGKEDQDNMKETIEKCEYSKHTASDSLDLENSDGKTTDEIGDVSKCESSIGSEVKITKIFLRIGR